MAAHVSVAELIDRHVAHEVECLDRIYLNATSRSCRPPEGGVVLAEAPGNPIPSPALFAPIENRVREDVNRFAMRHDIPADPLRQARPQDRRGASVSVRICRLPSARAVPVLSRSVWRRSYRTFSPAADDRPLPTRPSSSPSARRRARHLLYFYVWDDDFGSGFIKLCAYFPYPGKVGVNGHEWAMRRAAKAGIGFTALSNGFASSDDPDRLQAICDRLGPNQILAFFARWLRVIPLPLTAQDRAGDYWWELSMRQIEVSRTLVFDAPRRARALFEAVVRHNLDVGRPHEVELISTGKVGGRGRRHKQPTTNQFKTKLVTDGVGVTVNAFWKHSRRTTGPRHQRGPRAMALAGACRPGFTNRSLRAHVAGLFGPDYSVNQLSYDLARLRLHGLIRRLDRQHRYVLTDQGRRFAVFYTKLGSRVVALVRCRPAELP